MPNRTPLTISCLAVCVALSSHAVGQVITEDEVLQAADPMAASSFGIELAAGSGVIAAGYVDAAAGNGRVDIFGLHDRARLLTLESPTPDVGDAFGQRIALDGSIAVISATGDDELGVGAAFLFDLGSGQLLHKLLPNPAQAYWVIGSDVAITGTTVAVSSEDDGSFGPGAGATLLFSALTGQQTRKLYAFDAQPGDSFGHALALQNTTLVVGAPYEDERTTDAGAVYVIDTSTLAQRKILPPEIHQKAAFGFGVAVGEGLIAVGAPGEFDENNLFTGAVYVFDQQTLQLLHTLRPGDTTTDQYLGHSVSISDGRIVAGAIGDLGSGSVYIFNASTGELEAKLRAETPVDGDRVGYPVAATEGIVAASTTFNSVTGDRTGSVYIFDLGGCGPADLAAPFNNLDFFDVSAFLGYFSTGDPLADLAEPAGTFDFFDVSAFLAAYNAGCP